MRGRSGCGRRRGGSRQAARAALARPAQGLALPPLPPSHRTIATQQARRLGAASQGGEQGQAEQQRGGAAGGGHGGTALLPAEGTAC